MTIHFLFTTLGLLFEDIRYLKCVYFCGFMNIYLLRIINNINRLLDAIERLRTATIKNLEFARNFKPSPLCVKKYLNAVACQHCQANSTLACPNSCRLVTLFCLEPLRRSFEPPFSEFIR